MYIKKANQDDLEDVLQLYTHLHNNKTPALNDSLQTLCEEILADRNHKDGIQRKR